MSAPSANVSSSRASCNSMDFSHSKRERPPSRDGPLIVSQALWSLMRTRTVRRPEAIYPCTRCVERWARCLNSPTTRNLRSISCAIHKTFFYCSGANIGSHEGSIIGFCSKSLSVSAGIYLRLTTTRNIYSSNHSSVMIRLPL